MDTDKDQFRAPSSESLDAGYEISTVSIKALAWFVVGLIIVAAIIHAGVWFLFKEYVKADEKKDQPFSALTDERFIGDYNREHRSALKVSEIPPPPAPRIQSNDPAADLRDMFRREDEVFSRIGWEIDPQSHVQLKIPPQVLSAVIREETLRQQQEKKPK